MTRRHLQPFRWIKRFATTSPRELAVQLATLEKAVYEALDGAFNSALDYVGLDGIDVVAGATQSTVRSSRDTLTTTASGEIDSLGGIATKDFVRFDPSAHVRVNGLRPPETDDTHRIMLCNVSAYTVTLAHDDADATTEEARILCPHGVDYELRPHECIAADWHVADQKYRVFGKSQLLHLVRTAADLPTASGGVITLTAGLWAFMAGITATSRVVQPAGAHVWCPSLNSYLAANTASAALTVENHLNFNQMQVVNFGAGLSVTGAAAAGLDQEFRNWFTNFGGRGASFTSPSVRFSGGQWGAISIAVAAGSRYSWEQTTHFGVTIASGTVLDSVRMTDTVQPDVNSGNPLFTAPNGVAITGGVYMYRCEGNDNGIVSLGTGINAGGAFPRVVVTDCIGGSNATGDIVFGIVPGGGATITSCKLWTTPFNGFTSLTAGVMVYNCRTVFGGTIQNTPNGHIVKEPGGAQLTQRHFLLPSGGLTTSDDGTNTVISGAALDVGIGAANTVLQTNAAANAREWELLFNANVDPNAAIVVTKLAVSGDNRSVLQSDGGANAWTPDPEVDNISVYEALHLLSDDDPGDPADGVSLYYNGVEDKLIAAFDDTFRWDMIPNQPFVSGQHAKHFYERYVFDTDTAYTVLTESYTSPFGLTHGTSSNVIVEGWLSILSAASGTSGGFRKYQFGLRWTDSGTLEYRWDNNDYSQGTSGGQLATTVFSISEGASTTAVFAVSVGAVDSTMQFTIEGDIFVAPEPA